MNDEAKPARPNAVAGIAIVCLCIVAMTAIIGAVKFAKPCPPCPECPEPTPVIKTFVAPEAVEEEFGTVIPQRKPSDAELLEGLKGLVESAKTGDSKAMVEVRSLLSSTAKTMPKETVIRLMEILLEWREQMNDVDPTEGPST